MKTAHEYARLRELNKSIRQSKKRLIRDIMTRVNPYMWMGGYEFKLLVFPGQKQYKIRALSIAAVSGKYSGIEGFTEDGCVITDSYCGALSTQHLSTLCVEDLINLWAWVERNEKTLIKSNKHYTDENR